MHLQKDNREANISRLRDLPLHTYNQKQQAQITPMYLRLAASKIQQSGNFLLNDKVWKPNSYKGYAIVSMIDNNPGNEELPAFLTNIQNELLYNLQPVNSFYMLPSGSFHQTIANTLSAVRFKKNVSRKGIEDVYPSLIGAAFKKTWVTKQLAPIRMRLIGLGILHSAIVVLGIFEDAADYKRITDFRSGFYEDKQLSVLDVKMTRLFVGHITLAYSEQKLNKNQRAHLVDTISEINEKYFSRKHYFNISHTELRRYEHLAEFITEDNFPKYQFTL